MVGSALRAARLQIDVNPFALLEKRPSRQDVIDSPIFVFVERTRAKMIQKRELLPAGIEIAEYGHKSPKENILEASLTLP